MLSVSIKAIWASYNWKLVGVHEMFLLSITDKFFFANVLFLIHDATVLQVVNSLIYFSDNYNTDFNSNEY